MMDYWQGAMNWPLDENWKCPICGKRWLTWGLNHGECRCEVCHTEFMMRDGDTRVATPIWLLEDEYKQPFRYLWYVYRKPIDKYTDDEWDEAFSETSEPQWSGGEQSLKFDSW